MSNVRPNPARAKGVRKPVEHDPGLVWGPLNSLLLGLGLALLAIGFWVLSRGSLTLAPVLLVLAYVGLVPAALLVRGGTRPSGE